MSLYHSITAVPPPLEKIKLPHTTFCHGCHRFVDPGLVNFCNQQSQLTQSSYKGHKNSTISMEDIHPTIIILFGINKSSLLPFNYRVPISYRKMITSNFELHDGADYISALEHDGSTVP